MKRVVLAAGFVVAGLSAANAADEIYLPDDMTSPVSAFQWDRMYMGLSVGALQANFSPTGNDVQPSGWGVTGGIYMGRNWQFGEFVVGVEGDLQFSTEQASEPCFDPAFTCMTYVGITDSLRARAGYAMDRVLVYVTAGVTFADIGGSVSDGVTTFADRLGRTGYTVGGGVEWAVFDNASAKLEYRFSDYFTNDMEYDVIYPGVGTTTHTLTTGFAWHF